MGGKVVDTSTWSHWSEDPEFNPYLAYISGGFFTFVCVNWFTKYAVPASVYDSKKQGAQKFMARWKWRNTLTSFIHSTLTGIWAPLAFHLEPKLGEDMITGFTKSAHILVCISIGYFCYDLLDMGLYTWHKRSTKELLVHHTVVIACFGIAASNMSYVAYASLSLVVEINSVFLHARQLLIIAGVSKCSLVYRLVALLNLVTYVFFRILLLGWMTRWLTIHRDDVPLAFFTIGSVGLACIVVLNTVNFYRVLSSDFLKNPNSAVVKASNKTSIKFNGAPAQAERVENLPISKDVNWIMHSLFNGEDLPQQDIPSMNIKKYQ